MAIAGTVVSVVLIVMYCLGFSLNHLVIISCFAASIFFGAIIIADDGEEKKDNMYNDFGKPARNIPGDKNK